MNELEMATTSAKMLTFMEHQSKQNLRVAKALDDIARLIDIVNDKVNNLKN